MQKKEPWIVAKQASPNPSEGGASDAQKSIDNTMHLCLQLSANLAILINPFLPNTAKTMLSMMKVVEKLLSVGYSLREPQLLFRKIEDTEIAEQVEKLKAGLKESTAAAKENKPQQSKPMIQFDDFAKLELKAGTITACEKVEKADKLLKLEVDIGTEKRTIVSGIAQHYSADEMIGKQVVVVTNLAPRKMKGIESQGMILTAEDSDGKLQLLKPENPVSPGSNVS